MKHKNKKRWNAGESVAEALISVMIVSLSMMILCGAVVSVGKVNDKVNISDTAFQKAETPIKQETTSIHVEGQSYSRDVELYTTDNGYYYYEPKQPNETE